jgi:soluble lytic murein transglycosylase-like protein
VPRPSQSQSRRPSWRANPRAKNYVRIIEEAAKEHGIDAEMLGSVIERESQFDPDAVSPAGAAGIAQLVSRYHPDVDVSSPVASIRAAAKYLKANMKRFGDVPRALAAYNHGPTAIRSYGADWRAKIPKETSDYLAALAPPEDLTQIIDTLRK